MYRTASHAYSVLTGTAADSRVTTTTYDDDPLLRISRVIPPGHTPSNAVDTRYGRWGTASGPGRSYQTVDDEKGVLTTSVHDAYGRMQYAIADSAGASAATRNNRTSFAYDALDRLTSTTMPGGGTSRYAYDTLGHMTSRHHPDADGATLYKYDDLGRLRFSQDARQRALTPGKVTYTVYDDFGRVTRVGEANATFSSLDPERSYAFERDSASWRSRMTYDDGGGSAAGSGANYAQGRLVKVEENTDADAAAEVVHRYAYDHLGNVRVKQVVIEGLAGAKTATYHHDLAGRVTLLVYPDGTQARYAYDGAGRLSRVWDAEGITLARYTHTAAGNIATHVVGQGAGDTTADGVVTGTYAYNPREWVTGIDYAGTFRDTLTYDLAGNVTRQRYQHGTAAAKTADYAYDNLYRITGFDLTGGVSEDFTYDRNGNIKTVASGGSTLTYKYSSDSTPNRLDSTAVGSATTTYAYNRNGWMTRKGADTVAYDYRGLTTGYGSARYLMDPDRRRVKKTVGTAVTYYVRGPGGNVLAEYKGQSLSAKYVYAGSRRIARIAGDSASYYLADHLGSTRSLVDEAGSVTVAYDYWPYGKVLASSGSGSTHFRFTGHERDAESGLDYMLERSYAYDVGRFLRPDPMQDEYPGISPYAYAANNPLKYVDPDGRKLRFAPGTTKRFRGRFASTVKYLNQHKASAILARLESYDSVINVAATSKGSYYDHKTKTIFWNPTMGISTNTGNRLSPTTGLIHEADHAEQHDQNPVQFSIDVETPNEAFDDEEEKRVIYGLETDTARALGEIRPNEYTRHDHGGKAFIAISPTSNLSVTDYVLEPIEVIGEREEDPSP